MEIIYEFAGADNAHAFFWETEIAGRRIEGADLMRYDEQGRIAEIRVLIRPLVSIAVFASAVGPPLAATQGSARGALARLLTLPLKGFLTVVDVAASRLTGLR